MFKVNLNRWIKAIAVFLFVCSVALIANPLSAVASPSSYPQTCYNISIEQNVLSATCRRRDQSLNPTSIILRGIENIDGNLKVLNPTMEANFHLTCTDTSVSGNVLSSTCETMNGSWNPTSTIINGIENIDGELQYTSSP